MIKKRMKIAIIWASMFCVIAGLIDFVRIFHSSSQYFYNIYDIIGFLAFSMLFYYAFGFIMGLIVSFLPIKSLKNNDDFLGFACLHLSFFIAISLSAYIAMKHIKFGMFTTHLIKNIGILALAAVILAVLFIAIKKILLKINFIAKIIGSSTTVFGYNYITLSLNTSYYRKTFYANGKVREQVKDCGNNPYNSRNYGKTAKIFK